MGSQVSPAIYASALPRGLPLVGRFAMARRAGFLGLEIEAPSSLAEVEAIGEAAERVGIVIHALSLPQAHKRPLSDREPAAARLVLERSLTALDHARRLGARSLLILPGRVDAETSHAAAGERVRRLISEELIPAAEEARVVLTLENTWDGPWPAPGEFAAMIDSFASSQVRACLDLGNCIHGHPHHWVTALGPRIFSLHLKDFRMQATAGSLSRRAGGRYALGRMGEGDIDWRRVGAALHAAGFSGWGSCAELWHDLPTRAVGRAPHVLAPLHAALVERSLRDMRARFGRYLGAAGQAPSP